jgi:hypothetical protein
MLDQENLSPLLSSGSANTTEKEESKKRKERGKKGGKITGSIREVS